MSKMSEADMDRQQIERLTVAVRAPPTISPTPWELIEANEHHGAYIVNAYGADVCDLYAMSNPLAASMRNGGNSFPVPFTDADANAAFIVRAVNAHADLLSAAKEVMAALEKHGASIVPHLIDTDMNAGQRLRDAIAKAEAA